MIFAGVMALFKASIPETFAPVILKRRAAKLRKETGDPNICTEQEMFRIPFAEMMKDTLIRPFEMLATEPILLLLSMYIALIYGLLVSLLLAANLVIAYLSRSMLSSSVTQLSLVAITGGMTVWLV
jgi:hypothetical protein